MLSKKIHNKITHLLHPIIGEVWCLHRVVETRSLYPSNRDLEITPTYLEQLIQAKINNGYRFVSLDQLLQTRTLISKHKQINISFDDGFVDVYLNAFPIFKQYNIPFTIYLTTDFPDNNADLWWLQLEEFVTKPEEYETLIKKIYESGQTMASTMHKLTKSQPDMELTNRQSLTWRQIDEMVESGLCTIGSHTISHPGLTRIPKDDVAYELVNSKRIIEEHLKKYNYKVEHFSYPHSMQNEAIQDLVLAAGYKSATMGYGGSIRKGDNTYLLNREYIVQK